MNRRHFIHRSLLAAGALGAARLSRAHPTPSRPFTGINLFSKHLQFLDYPEMAAATRRMGFDGVDLTVRPGGHVEPATATRDLPRAATALRNEGFIPHTCVTGFSSVEDPHFDATLDAIADAGFSYLRLGWLRFTDQPHPARQIEIHHATCSRLAHALATRGLQGALQNHAGEHYIGSSLWEFWHVLEDIDPQHLGLQFDIRHATAERGASWRRELDVAAPLITSINCKDFAWLPPINGGRPRLVHTPLGDGWVDWPRYLELLRQHGLSVPANLHCEYDLGGAEHGSRDIQLPPDEVFRRIKRDLDRLRNWVS